MNTITEYIDLLPNDRDEIVEILSRNSLDTIETIRDGLTQGVEFSEEDYEFYISLLPYKYSFVLRECDRIIKSNQKQPSM